MDIVDRAFIIPDIQRHRTIPESQIDTYSYVYMVYVIIGKCFFNSRILFNLCLE